MVVTTPIGSVGKVLVISLQLNDGSRLDTNHTFTYRPEPVVTDIQPRNHLVVYVSYDQQAVKEFLREAASQRGILSLGKPNVTPDCFCGQPIGTLVDSMRGNPEVILPHNGPLRLGDLDPNTRFLIPPLSTSRIASRSV